MKNTAASVRQRLVNLAKERGVGFNRVLVQYGTERVLYRLSQSEHADKFVLKGAMLFVLWQGVQHRETRDMDLLGTGDNSPDAMRRVFEEVIALMEAEGHRLPPVPAKEAYSGKVLLRLTPEVHRRMAVQAKSSGESLNAFLVRKRLTT